MSLKISIASFITQLKASGTKSPITLKRIDTLNYILDQVSNLIRAVQSGMMNEYDIPITVNDYNNFLPFIDQKNAGVSQDRPLPSLINASGANSALMNLFPAYFQGDVSGAKLAQELLQKYASSFFQNVSYDVNVNFGKRSEAELEIDREMAAAIASVATNGNANLITNSNANVSFSNSGSSYEAVDNSTTSSGSFGSVIQNLMGGLGPVTNKPYILDWKQRSGDICGQISKRGLNPGDYGCLKNPEEVDQNFSYRGYAKMICARLETNYDPGIPELCGCPPPTWVGWRP